ncbi:hypothetical protein LAZ67_23000484 [Cordylochernes scorpioides]|uniref:Reverse transcriptase domain-containing protein n=1 Tax=Cordylochernes scorpioides TaxID=51811 RepID=A0ABY6LQE9_9ARAC|nr:hypothetical protein LAZ67_23000484 [Cordylochernes scorpioides]
MMSDPNLEYLAFYKRQLNKKSLQLARWRLHLAFNLKCSQASFIPPSLRIRDPVQNHYSAAIIHRTEKQLLNSRIRGSRAMVRFLQKSIRGLLCLLSPRIPSNDLGSLVQGITARVKLQNSEIELRHQRKLEFWHVKYGFPLRTRSPSEDTIVNLTDIVFSDKQISLLEKGLSFRLPNEPDLLYTISCIESSLQHQSHTDKHHIRSTIANKLLAAYKSSSSRPNSVKSDLASLKALKSHHDILITKSDKGSQVVVLKVDDYKKKMSDILSDSDTFQEISPERVCAISGAYKSSLRLLRINKCITPDQFQQFTSNLSRVPYIYGLPKTHKPSVPLRPIVAYHLSPALQLAKYLSSLQKPLVKTHNLYSVQDPSEFFTRLKSVPQPRGLTMSTFDVTSLFLCLPHSLIIDGLEQLLSSSTLPSNDQKTILDLFTICLDMNTLEFNGCFFVQMRGSPMGSPLTTIAAEIVMSNLDRWLVSHNHLGIEMWSRLEQKVEAVNERIENLRIKDSEAKPKDEGMKDSEDQPKGEGVKDSEDEPKGDEVKDSEDEPKGDGVRDSEAEPKDDEVKDSEDEPKDDGVKDSEDQPKGEGVKDSEAKPKGEGVKDSDKVNSKDEDEVKESEGQKAGDEGDGKKDSEAELKGGVKDSRVAEEKLDAERGTDSKVEEKLDAEQGTESKMEEGFIGGVDENPPEVKGQYLPRHLLLRSESKTTPIRPVFDDASCRGNGGLALRRYLRRIPILLRKIPEIGMELRENKFGVLADLRRYFRLMAIESNDWDYLRFIWKKKMDN